MALDFNQIIVAGNVGREPELRYTQSGQAILAFSVGETKRYQKDGEWKSRTQWWQIQVWGDQGVNLESRLSVGDTVVIVGQVIMGSYEKHGLEIPTWQVNAKMVRVLPKDREDKQKETKAKKGYEPPPPEDDLPF